MNEKIRELAVESGFATGYDRTQTGKWSLSDRELEKFAQLIVKECIDIISPYTVRMNKPGEIGHPIQEIREHFGVEE